MTHSRRDFFRSMAQIAAVTACAPALRVVENMVFVTPAPEIVTAYRAMSLVTFTEILNEYLTIGLLQECMAKDTLLTKIGKPEGGLIAVKT